MITAGAEVYPLPPLIILTTGETSGGFRMYEFLLFIPNEAQTHNINVDAAPFQPTDIIYKKVKDYIYEKYK